MSCAAWKKKSSSPFLLLLRYLKPELKALPRWVTKWRGGFGKGGRKKHVLCAWFCSTWVGTAHGRRLSQPSVSQGMLSCLPRPGAEPLEIPPRRAAPATDITTAPEARGIHCAWACRGLEALRWSPKPTGAWASLQPKELSCHQLWGTRRKKMGRMVSFWKPSFPVHKWPGEQQRALPGFLSCSATTQDLWQQNYSRSSQGPLSPLQAAGLQSLLTEGSEILRSQHQLQGRLSVHSVSSWHTKSQ